MWWLWLEDTISNFNGLDLSALNTDEAWLNITSSYGSLLWIYIVSNNCYTCSFQKFIDQPIQRNGTYNTTINTQYGLKFRVRTSGEFNTTPNAGDDEYALCDLTYKFGEFGVYTFHINDDSMSHKRCSVTEDLPPVNAYLPIPVVLTFWLLVGLVTCALKRNWRHFGNILGKFLQQRSENGNVNEATPIIHETGQNQEESEQKRDKRNRKKQRKQQPLSRVTQDETLPVQSTSSAACTDSSTPRSDGCIASINESSKERLRSLDAFRGLCILIMIVADDGGGGYFFLQHCAWDGLYIADIAFPWFIWICGVSIPFSIQSRLKGLSRKSTIFQEIAIRSLKLVLLGLIVNTSTRATAVQLEQLRFPGVLQRFGVCYLIGSSLFLFFYKNDQPSSNSDDQTPMQSNHRRFFEDFKCTVYPWIIVTFLVGIHTLILFTLPVPDCPTGYLGPAGLHNGSAVPAQCVGGAAGYLDRFLFGTNHIHNRPTATRVYGSGPFDPEGILGVLTSTLHVWLGAQAGMIMLTYRTLKSRVSRLITWSIVCGIFGLLLCGGYQNSGWIPLNKNLWSLSFVLVTSSAAFASLCLLYILIDACKIWSGSPILEAGRNSILLYLGHEFCHATLPWNFSYGKMTSHTSKLMETLWGITVWISIAVYLHDQQIFYVV